MMDVDSARATPAGASSPAAPRSWLRGWAPLVGAWLLLALAFAATYSASDWGDDPVGLVAHDTRPAATEQDFSWWDPQTWLQEAPRGSSAEVEDLRQQLEAARAESSALRQENARLRGDPVRGQPEPPAVASGNAEEAAKAAAAAALLSAPPGAAEAPAVVGASGGSATSVVDAGGAASELPPPKAEDASAPEGDSGAQQPLPGLVNGQAPVWHSYVHADPKDNPSADVATPSGLPADRPGHWDKAPWLLNDDKLIVDARPRSGPGSGGILVAFAILLDHKFDKGWGKKGKAGAEEEMKRPKWLRSCLAATRHRVRKFGHAMVIRWRPTLKVPERVLKDCHKKFKGEKDEEKCIKDEERETFNWEKELMILEYLSSPENFSHVLMLDADAALVHQEHDTLQLMAEELVKSGKDLFLSDEDWQANGRGRINGGLLFAANTDWNKQLFQDMLAAHMTGTVTRPKSIGGSALTCNSNEQLCLNGMKGRAGFEEHSAIWSGQTWNRGGCVLKKCFRGGGAMNEEMGKLRMRDPTMEIMHFMGGAKDNAVQAMCLDGVNVTGEPEDGYGCS